MCKKEKKLHIWGCKFSNLIFFLNIYKFNKSQFNWKKDNWPLKDSITNLFLFAHSNIKVRHPTGSTHQNWCKLLGGGGMATVGCHLVFSATWWSMEHERLLSDIYKLTMRKRIARSWSTFFFNCHSCKIIIKAVADNLYIYICMNWDRTLAKLSWGQEQGSWAHSVGRTERNFPLKQSPHTKEAGIRSSPSERAWNLQPQTNRNRFSQKQVKGWAKSEHSKGNEQKRAMSSGETVFLLWLEFPIRPFSDGADWGPAGTHR